MRSDRFDRRGVVQTLYVLALSLLIVVAACDASGVFPTEPVAVPRMVMSAEPVDHPWAGRCETVFTSTGPLTLEITGICQLAGLGRVTLVRSLIGLPVALSAPTRSADGKILMFAGDSPIMEPQQIEQVNAQRIRLNVKYPALLMLGQNVKAVGSDNFLIYAGYRLSAMRIRTLVPEPKGGSWVAYDLSSGELLRLRLREKAAVIQAPAK